MHSLSGDRILAALQAKEKTLPGGAAALLGHWTQEATTQGSLSTTHFQNQVWPNKPLLIELLVPRCFAIVTKNRLIHPCLLYIILSTMVSLPFYNL